MTNRISSSGYRHSLPRRFSRRFLSQQTTKKNEQTRVCMHGCMCAKNAVACFPLSLSLRLQNIHPPTDNRENILPRENDHHTRKDSTFCSEFYFALSPARRSRHYYQATIDGTDDIHTHGCWRTVVVCVLTHKHTYSRVTTPTHTCDVRPLVTFSHTRTTSGESAQKKKQQEHTTQILSDKCLCVLRVREGEFHVSARGHPPHARFRKRIGHKIGRKWLRVGGGKGGGSKDNPQNEKVTVCGSTVGGRG